MKLDKWMANKGLKQTDFAAIVGADQSIVSRWINGLALPTAPYLRAIEKATKRKVGFDDFDWPARESSK